MTAFAPLSISALANPCHKNPIHGARCYIFQKSLLPTNCYSLRCIKIGSNHQKWSKMKMWAYREDGFLHELRKRENGVLWGGKKLRREKRVVLVRFNNGFGFNGGGGGRDDGTTVRVLGNLALAVGLTYLTMNGQLGWVLDTIVSLWLLAFILPIVGIGAFLWWAGRDMIQGSCPNCGNAFQVFKSSLNEELPLCPFCSQPFSVDGNEFVKEPIKFSSKRSTAFGRMSDDFLSRSRKGKDTSTAIVVIEAEIKDAD